MYFNEIDVQNESLMQKTGGAGAGNNRLGIIYFILSGIFMTTMYFITRDVYEQNPTLAVWEFTLVRSVICTIIMLIYMNRHIKQVMIDEVSCSNVLPLMFRVFQNAACIILLYASLKYFPVNAVGAANLAMPFLTLIFAWMILRERVQWIDLLLVLAVSAGMGLIIWYTDDEAPASGAREDWHWYGIFILPVLMALGNVTMRALRQIPETTVATYQSLALAGVSIPLILYYDDSFDFWLDWNVKTWIYVVIASGLQLLHTTAKFAAYKERPANELQIYAFLPLVYQVLVELAIFKSVSYVDMQWVGLAIIAAAYVFIIFRFFKS